MWRDLAITFFALFTIALWAWRSAIASNKRLISSYQERIEMIGDMWAEFYKMTPGEWNFPRSPKVGR